MDSIYMSPQQYIQEEGVLDRAGELIAPLGEKPLVLGDELVAGLINARLERSFSQCGVQPSFVRFGGECTEAEVARLMAIVDREGLDAVVGTGGGKAIDTSRFVAERTRRPLITIPTSAATCSCASAAAVLYDEKGVRLTTVDGTGSRLCLVDSRIIAEAPARLLSSGMGDALSKWYEGRITASRIKMDPRVDGSVHLARHLREEIFQYGREACADVEQKRLTPAVEKMIGVNLLLTAVAGGIGGVRVRQVGAHVFLYAMTIIEGVHELLHGEVVSFGMLVQLALEQEDAELRNLMAFLRDIRLPLTLEALGMGHAPEAQLAQGARRMTVEGSPIHNLPFPVSSEDVLQAIYRVDEMARSLNRRK
ncbi:MAG: iron-containing alcohol dehydrogenase family protein [Deltaproteobacteria bacterium]|nr:iron-containing alcohol dehydrogenase family protein [Deltaproteobacteria bacterium]